MTNTRFKKTKIVATLGPRCNNKTIISKLIRAGVNVFRINFSHATHEEVDHYVEIIRKTQQSGKVSAFRNRFSTLRKSLNSQKKS